MLNSSDKADGSGKSSGAAGGQSSGVLSASPPAISLPKGGGAIRGMGEKFTANPVTGTGSMSVPIATSPGRSGFGPQLSLSYDSGSGNSPFGFGWSLSLPQITRKTDKGLPQYFDAVHSDVFILSGAEDLVPEFKKDTGGKWVMQNGRHVIHEENRTVGGNTYTVRRYRPRIEGLFARIERWTKVDDPNAGDVHWRSISKDNILTIYGKDAGSRIADPDPADPTRIFSWLICETRDDKGNAVVYKYKGDKGEDSAGLDLAQAHEANRGDADDPHRRTNRYIKHIRYGNRRSLLVEGKRPPFLTQNQIDTAGWMFQVVFDYGEHDEALPTPAEIRPWPRRLDPFSTYRAGFEVRTYRLCQRVLMFHHFPDEPDVRADCLVRSTDFEYSHERSPDAARDPVYSFLLSVAHSSYRRDGIGYLPRSLPPVEFKYTRPMVQSLVEEVDAASLENLPAGLNGGYQWTDLHGEGVPGILTEQGDAWYYKRNLSPTNLREHNGKRHLEAQFAPVELVAAKPNLSLGGGAQFMDLAGDGQPDLVMLDGPLPGLYEHDEGESWQLFRPFIARLNRVMGDPNMKFVDLDGDGRADVLITEDEALVWHPSLAEAGFGPARRVAQALDEEKGPRLVFADRSQSIYLADLSGDGLTDLARVRNGEVCYWPNLGYGHFGPKVAMDNAPRFDNPDQFDQRRVRLADIDGSGTTDIIYLHRDGVRLYFNQSGNSWGQPQALDVFPHVDSLTDVTVTDLLGNGTACLVWSSPLPGDTRRPMRYVNLMGNEKPHLLVGVVNNLGAETRVRYAPSTKFYLADKLAGRPWITRLPFPVHVVERVETHDYVSRNRFVTAYTYHHGYFDGEEREFRGFGMVEQTDTEAFASLTAAGELPPGDNESAASHVPPVLTRTWFHTGVYFGRDRISNFFAGLLVSDSSGDRGEYYREPARLDNDDEAKKHLLPDTILPDGLTIDEERQAARALKGTMLRQEIYALDGVGSDDNYPNGHPYTVAEQNFTVRLLQPQGPNRHAVFFTHPREALTYHYEREPADPRLQHALTLEVDEYGNVLKSAAVGYGRRRRDATLPTDGDRDKQALIHITYTENSVTNAITNQAEHYRTPLPAESRTYELRKAQQEKSPVGLTNLYRFGDLLTYIEQAADGNHDIAYEDMTFARAQLVAAQPAESESYFRRRIEHVRTLYRPDDCGVAQNDPLALLALETLEPLALPGESYKLALTPSLLAAVFKRRRADGTAEDLRPPNLATLLEGRGEDEGGYVAMDGDWWIPSGRVFYHRDNVAASVELVEAQAHFFLPRRFRDPFGQETKLDYDGPADPNRPRYDLLVTRTADAAQNVMRAENDYRVLQPYLMTDPNRNRTQVAFDALGLVAGTAVMGKPTPAPAEGDSLAEFVSDLAQSDLDAFFETADPHTAAPGLLKDATTRVVYDLDRFRLSRQAHPDDPAQWLPAYAATLARETHAADPLPPDGLKIQLIFSYSDGFGREIQKKIQAEPGPLVEGGPEFDPCWVGSGWTIFNNKGKPVRQYEPFFSGTHDFEFGVEVGVSPILFYDPAARVVATLHPNHTWEKVVFDPWQQATYDANDTVTSDPAADPDVKGFFVNPDGTPRLPDEAYLPTWHALRTDAAQAAHFAEDYPDATLRAAETAAAGKAAAHAGTPTVAHFDALGRLFLTFADNGPDPAQPAQHLRFATRLELDIEGNERAVRDAVVQAGDPLGRVVMRYAYDMLGNRIHQASMEAGERWTLNDATGKPIRAWDSRGFIRRMTYDELRRPTGLFVTENGGERQAEHTVYGEGQGDAGNHRGRVFQLFDGAGIVTSDAYDFKGNLKSGRREMPVDYKAVVNWPNPIPGGSETFITSTTYDALNRPTTIVTPDGSVYRPDYNEANLLNAVTVDLEGVPTPFVDNIDYNAKGQRERIVYGNGATTAYTYDPLTFRLTNLRTTRPAGVNGLSALFKVATTVQDLRYTYDPAGNITRIEDAALETVVHAGLTVAPVCAYTYDAVYRLIEAHGREHIGQTAFDFDPPDGNFRDYPFVGLRPHANNPEAMRTYTERYDYDAVGNFKTMRHSATNGSWTRTYAYNEASLLEDGTGGTLLKQSNRLSSTTVGNGLNHPESYAHDAHGNMIRMSHLGGAHPADNLHWDFEDQLERVDLRGGETAYYVYDAAGQRARKVIEAAGGAPREERIYLGGYEVYRKRSGTHAGLERRTLHIMDDQQRIALVETRNNVNDGTLKQAIRYQLGNHLGSASVELDKAGSLISYEEYHPYGTTAFQAHSSAEVSLKRYRYTGKERDEESGLYYHGARYYAPWLGWWTCCDPSGLVDGANLYFYAQCAPTTFTDFDGRQSVQGLSDYNQWARGIDKNKDEMIIFGPVDTSKLPKVGNPAGAQPTPSLPTLPPPDSASSGKPSENPTPPASDTKVFDPYSEGVSIDTGWRVTGSNFLWEGTKQAYEAALDPSFSNTERYLFLIGANIGLAGSALEQHVLNPFLNAPAQAYESGQLTARSVHRASRGEYMKAIQDAKEAKDKFESAVTSVVSVVLPVAEGAAALKAGGAATKSATVWENVEKQGESLLKNGGKLVGRVEKHHVFPQRFRDFFRSKGILIDEYMLEMDREIHKLTQRKGRHYEDYTKKWGEWIEKNRDAKPEAVFEYAGKLMDEYGHSLGFRWAE